MWFLPIDGVSIVDPRRLSFNNLPPPVYIEQIIADRETYDCERWPSLPRADARSANRLHGAESRRAGEEPVPHQARRPRRDWQDVGTRAAGVLHRPRSRHVPLPRRRSNNSGVWNETGATLDSRSRRRTTRRGFRRDCVAAFALLWVAYGLRSVKLRGSSTAPWTRASASGRASRGNCTIRCCRASTVCCCGSRPPSYLLPERPAEAKNAGWCD